jgi:hypothetical protein
MFIHLWKEARRQELQAELEHPYESNYSDWHNLTVFDSPQRPDGEQQIEFDIAA